MSDPLPGSDLAELIAAIPDYPSPGVLFRDITPLIAHPGGLAAAIEQMVAAGPREVDIVVGLEARGFIFGPAMALALGAGFVPARKPDKLPRAVESVTYDLEYGRTSLAVHADAFGPGTRVLIADDVLATGGTAAAAAELVRRLGGELVGITLLLELSELGGRERLTRLGFGPVASVLTFGAS
ncbi:MAG: adenine phosphoribosyltransferase [Microlunatus sp.]